MLRCKMRVLALFVVMAFLFVSSASGDSHTKEYKDGDEVIVWVNHVMPFHNPQETYLYYSLPFCEPDEVVETHAEGLGEALQGYELRKSAINVNFKEDLNSEMICTKTLTEEEARKFSEAVKNEYIVQLYVDDLPMFGVVGEMLTGEGSTHKLYIYTHKKFMATYNGDRIIEVNFTSENPVEIRSGEPISFTYSIHCDRISNPRRHPPSRYPTDIPYELRYEKYLDDNFFEHQIHWFSVFNSAMMVIFLVGLVSMILLRTLRRDIARYAREDDLEDDDRLGDESGWKLVHGDVFRPPPYLVTFAALIGTGYQLATLTFCVILFAIIGTYYRKRGTIVTAFVLCYALTSFIGGYASGGFYSRNGGQLWIKNMLIIAGLFPGLMVCITLVLDAFAIAYGSLASIPIGTMFAVSCIWLFLSLPLTIAGTIVGKNTAGRPKNPCRINPVPRNIPYREWYLQPWVNIVLGGILPFGSIFIEIYFVFTALWHHKTYYVYGFLLLCYIILILVTLCVNIVSVYFLLNAEDWRWQWTSFLSGASTSVYVFFYSAYYYLFKTNMSGAFQAAFFFGYVIMFCIGLGILCGSVGYFGASIFTRSIFSNLKLD